MRTLIAVGWVWSGWVMEPHVTQMRTFKYLITILRMKTSSSITSQFWFKCLFGLWGCADKPPNMTRRKVHRSIFRSIVSKTETKVLRSWGWGWLLLSVSVGRRMFFFYSSLWPQSFIHESVKGKPVSNLNTLPFRMSPSRFSAPTLSVCLLL